MSSEEINWITKERDVYDSQNHTQVAMEFHRKNIQEEYNYGTNNIYLGDQLRNYYRMDRRKRQLKWWLALWMWGFEVCLVNAYVAYVKICTNIYNIEKKMCGFIMNFKDGLL